MIVYVGIALIILLGSITKQSKSMYYVSLSLLFFSTAFKDISLGGTDAIIYQDFFQRIPKITELFGYQSKYTIGYTLLNSFVKLFSSEYMVYQVLYVLLSTILLYLVLEQLEITNKEKCLFLFSYFCFRYIWYAWGLLRQNLANLFFWLFIILLYKKIQSLKENRGELWCKETIILFLLAIILPILFHTSAWVNIVLVPAVLLLGRVNHKIKMYMIPVISVGLYAFGERIYSYFLRFAALHIDVRYSMYIERAQGDINVINYIFRLFFFMFFAFVYQSEKYRYKNMVLDMMAVMILIGSVNAELMVRLCDYYTLGLYICMALFLRNFSRNGKVIAISIYGAAMIIILCRFVTITGGGYLLNYQLFI